MIAPAFIEAAVYSGCPCIRAASMGQYTNCPPGCTLCLSVLCPQCYAPPGTACRIDMYVNLLVVPPTHYRRQLAAPKEATP